MTFNYIFFFKKKKKCIFWLENLRFLLGNPNEMHECLSLKLQQSPMPPLGYI